MSECSKEHDLKHGITTFTGACDRNSYKLEAGYITAATDDDVSDISTSVCNNLILVMTLWYAAENNTEKNSKIDPFLISLRRVYSKPCTLSKKKGICSIIFLPIKHNIATLIVNFTIVNIFCIEVYCSSLSSMKI